MHDALNDIDLILYDLDGTLIDSAPDLALAIDEMMQAMDLPPAGVDRVRDWVGNGSRRLVERALMHSNAFGASGPDSQQIDDALALFMDFYAQHPVSRTCCYPGVVECLRAQRERGIAQALVTNKPSRFIDTILASMGLEGFFSHVLGGDSLAQKKPDPAPLAYIASALNIPPRRVLMVGDSRSDVKAARAFGCRSLAVTYGYNHGEPIAALNPDHLLDSLGELV
ncbi:phosphoglycolate phosphatase [Kushneria marisflavi]|uniref:Phosphoglycolate phosphatase n=1 Tax=Kushneria marisflavi TaxID=157779 RepID=A0A240URR1_9GAMM|nr:phosphoglycolate phosphatase [Kushneria marisflavi]ART64181.1 phosphoglycolate phosphatase [Kushneria marisflavi]RKD76636.1 phosphoglycolate phosphatase [Kushneria marisflavi]